MSGHGGGVGDFSKQEPHQSADEKEDEEGNLELTRESDEKVKRNKYRRR